MLALFTIAYWAFFVASLPFFFAAALLVFLMALPFDRRRTAVHLYGCFWASCYVWMNPLWHVRFEGRERLPWKGPAVIVANHLSLLDILVLYGLFRPFKWVSKESNFRLPFVGWNMTLADYVPLKRGDRESIRKMMAHCRAHLEAGSPVLIFPEGTRSQDGALQPFKDGAFRLAREVGCPVIPIALSGTFTTLPKHGFVLRQVMRARVQVLPPIDPTTYASDTALRDATRAAIAAALPVEASATARP
jgi:1-acyl-sn-glycerol-3-phosphate acyltransferase